MSHPASHVHEQIDHNFAFDASETRPSRALRTLYALKKAVPPPCAPLQCIYCMIFKLVMSTLMLPVDQEANIHYDSDWTSKEGLSKLQNLIHRSLLPYKPRYFQLYNAACLLSGQDVMCISATGEKDNVTE